MSKLILFIAILFSVSIIQAQQTFTVTAVNNTFSPATIDAVVGDKVTFSVGSFHPVLQVSEASFNANQNTALPGGFSFPSGAGDFITSQAGTFYYICKNHIASGMKGKIIVSDPLSVENEIISNSFDIFPNPVENFINIKNPDNSSPRSVSLFDMSGKLIYFSESLDSENNKSTVSAAELRKGMYFITVVYAEKTYSRKFIKL